MNPIDTEELSELIRSAGKRITQGLGSSQIQAKGKADFVTKTDIDVQNYLTEELDRRYPQIGMIGEEAAPLRSDGANWILDPIDGTTNYIYHYRHSAISLALHDGSDIVYGAVYNPYTQELFHACRGEGAFLNGTPLKANPAEHLGDSLIAVGTSPYYKELSEVIFTKIHRLYQSSLDIRRSGSAALDLAYIACGRIDAYFEYRLKPWDYAAGYLLVQEAGGTVAGIDRAISFDAPSDVAAGCTSTLLEEMLEILRTA